MWLFQLSLVLLFAGCGLWLARLASRRPLWIVPLVLTLLAVACVAVARRVPRLAFVTPFSWLVDVEVNPVLMAGTIALLFGLLVPRLQMGGQQRAVRLLAAVMIAYYGLVPILAPVIVRPSLARGQTQVDATNVCRQRHDYTCGPAAGVTVLRWMGVHAEEGPLAIASWCGPAVGADGHILAAAMTGAAGGKARFVYRWVGEVEKLTAPAVVSLDTKFLTGHYVAVLEISDSGVTVGDPLSGMQRYSKEDFRKEWNGAGVVVVPP